MALTEVLALLPPPFNLIPVWVALLLLTWSVFWTGFALWKSARKNQPVWFVVFFILHTAGILEAIYIFIISKSKSRKK